ncbi:SigB/SigF/SigG family RNA polymerase sigma factor [Dactylosporangium sp. CS-047395]|uniref:SigB/SigF/SigG family RNA polymerase sigma factor n=1 Tax=Dactylosporangium sp. CS-047395 TaxID=3239936 RepID=UPI003D8B7BC8
MAVTAPTLHDSRADLVQDAARLTRIRPASREETDAVALALLSLLGDLPDGSPDRDRVRGRLIELYLPLAKYLAQRFRNRGEPLDDLVQVANVGLIQAVDGFDATRGAAFTSYAIPMISGMLKRHFRDRCWDVRVPRRVQELRQQINRVTETLTHTLGRSPTVADLAAAVDATEEEVIEALEAGSAYKALSLDAPVGGDDQGVTVLGDMLGHDDTGLELAEAREALRPLLARLPAREQTIVAMRFHGGCTQSQIATELGISQMHVSRLLAGALTTLRNGLLAG